MKIAWNLSCAKMIYDEYDPDLKDYNIFYLREDIKQMLTNRIEELEIALEAHTKGIKREGKPILLISDPIGKSMIEAQIRENRRYLESLG